MVRTRCELEIEEERGVDVTLHEGTTELLDCEGVLSTDERLCAKPREGVETASLLHVVEIKEELDVYWSF